MAGNIVYEKMCTVCLALKPITEFFKQTASAKWPERATTCRRCLQIGRFWSYVLKSSGCWVWTRRCNSDGYGMFDHGSAHRFSWVLHNGPVPQGLCVLHHCDNPPCVKPDHLYCGTKKQNYKDMVQRRRAATEFITQQRLAVLTPQLVREARIIYKAGGISIRNLANQFGVSSGTMQHALEGRTWKYVV